MAIRELAETWASLYSNSVAIRSVVSFAHFGGLMTGGGTAIAADLGMLGAIRSGHAAALAEIARLHRSHRLVIGSLAVVVASGLLLLFKDLDTYLASTPFWIKMALFAALILNGLVVVRAERRATAGDASALGMLRAAAIASLALWLATTLVGVVVPNAL